MPEITTKEKIKIIIKDLYHINKNGVYIIDDSNDSIIESYKAFFPDTTIKSSGATIKNINGFSYFIIYDIVLLKQYLFDNVLKFL